MGRAVPQVGLSLVNLGNKKEATVGGASRGEKVMGDESGLALIDHGKELELYSKCDGLL